VKLLWFGVVQLQSQHFSFISVVNSSLTRTVQVWRVNGQEKILLPASDQSKFYSGDCFIFQYSYPGEDKDDCLIGTWIGKNSVEVKDFEFNCTSSPHDLTTKIEK
jgi:uncharacterized protein YpmB